MKLLSSLPALIAKITDLVDRTVTSDIEVLQQTFFPLLRFSGPVRPTPASVNVLTQSGIVTMQGIVANGGAAQVTLCGLREGIWDIDVQGFYTANYQAAVTDGLEIRLVTAATTLFADLCFTMATVSPAGAQFSRKLRVTLDRSDLALETVLSGNGVGQSHMFIGSVACQKLL